MLLAAYITSSKIFESQQKIFPSEIYLFLGAFAIWLKASINFVPPSHGTLRLPFGRFS